MKKMILAAFVAAVGVTAGYGVYNSQTTSVLPGLALKNIEALSSDESALVPCYPIIDTPCEDEEGVYLSYN